MDRIKTIESRTRMVFMIGFALYLCWCGLYVLRTSFIVDAKRVFCLWDDGMVSMRYARNLATGHGLVWNAGAERVQGYSNLGVTLIMAAIHLLPLDRTKTSLVFQLLNLALLASMVLLTRAIVRRLFENEAAGDAAGLAIMACAPLSILGLQGTDVAAISVLLLIAFRAVVCSTASGGYWPDWVYLVLAAGVVIRLDFVLVFCVFAAASTFFPRTRSSPFVAIFVLAITLLSILGWQFAYYGNPLPNTYYLKLTGTPIAAVLLRGISHTAVNLFVHNLVLLGATASALFAFQRRDRRLWLLGLLALALVAYNIRVGGDWIDGSLTSRFLAPGLPLLLIAAVGACWRILQHLDVREAIAEPAPGSAFAVMRPMLIVVLGILIGLSLCTDNSLREWFNPWSDIQFRISNVPNVKTAFSLQQHTSPDMTLSVASAGATPYFLDRYTIDVLGKTEPHIAHLVVPYFNPALKTDWDYILRYRQPDILDYPDLTEYPLELAHRVAEEYVRVEAPDNVVFFVRRVALPKLRGAGLRISSITPG